MSDVSRSMAEVLDYLNLVAGMENGARLFATFVLRHGKEWKSAVFDLPFGKGPTRACYQNSQALLFSDMGRARPAGLVYVEGYACSASVGFSFVTEHAWLVDADGNVVDPTWDDPERSAYFGVPFRSDYVREIVGANGPCSLIDDFRSRWELVRIPEVADRAVLQWSPAPAES